MTYQNDIPKDVATGAFNGTSWSPEKRGEGWRQAYAETLTADIEVLRGYLKDHPDADSEIERYRQNLRDKYLAYLHSHANIVSSFIAGPSNFPARRMEKRNRWADNHYAAIDEFRERAKKAIKRKYAPFDGHAIKSHDPDALDKLKAKLAKREADQERMKAANKIVKSKKLTNAEKLEQLKPLECSCSKLLEPDFCGRIGFPGYMLSNNNANIKRIRDRIAELEQRDTEAESGPVEEQHGDITYLEDFEDGRVRLIFPGKPSSEVRSLLKSNGFRWSPRNTAWQRQLTDNGRSAARYVLGQL